MKNKLLFYTVLSFICAAVSLMLLVFEAGCFFEGVC